MYLKEVGGIFIDDIKYKIVSNNRSLNDSIIIKIDTTNKELRLYELESIKSVCAVEEFNDLLESIKFIWELNYPDYEIKYWRTESNAFFINWLGIENLKNIIKEDIIMKKIYYYLQDECEEYIVSKEFKEKNYAYLTGVICAYGTLEELKEYYELDIENIKILG